MGESINRAEAERLLGIAEKQLQKKDYYSSRDFAILAQENDPLLEGSDQILAVTEVLVAAEKRINNHHDWYAILQIDRRSHDLELIKKQYRRLALLLHPDKNKFAFADTAFKLVADAWAVLSDSIKKSLYDNELSLFSKVDLVATRKQKEFHQHHQSDPQQNQQKLPVRRNSRPEMGEKKHGNDGDGTSTTRLSSFWTACPYCYNLYEYPRVYDGCCLRCQNCQRAFHAAEIQSLPPLVPGKEAYYCCWGFFPMGFMIANSEGGKSKGFPNWMPPMFPTAGTAATAGSGVAPNGGATHGGGGFVDLSEGNAAPAETVVKRRGRPKKNVYA